MRLNVADLASVSTTDAFKTGWNQPTHEYAALPERLAQCDLDDSAVDYRMDHRDGFGDESTGTQMPPIDTHQVDTAGLAALPRGSTRAAATAGSTEAEAPSGGRPSPPPGGWASLFG
jgi:hypothetical protein